MKNRGLMVTRPRRGAQTETAACSSPPLSLPRSTVSTSAELSRSLRSAKNSVTMQNGEAADMFNRMGETSDSLNDINRLCQLRRPMRQ
jgi:hypothetical protein